MYSGLVLRFREQLKTRHAMELSPVMTNNKARKYKSTTTTTSMIAGTTSLIHTIHGTQDESHTMTNKTSTAPIMTDAKARKYKSITTTKITKTARNTPPKTMLSQQAMTIHDVRKSKSPTTMLPKHTTHKECHNHKEPHTASAAAARKLTPPPASITLNKAVTSFLKSSNAITRESANKVIALVKKELQIYNVIQATTARNSQNNKHHQQIARMTRHRRQYQIRLDTRIKLITITGTF